MPKKLELRILSDPKELAGVREKTRAFFADSDFSEAEKDKIVLAIGEACANSMRHSYKGRPNGRIEITLEDQPGQILIKIRDFGEKIDLSKIKTPKLPPTELHGLGVYFMKTIMDKIEYNTALPEGNEVALIKHKKPNENQN